MSEYNITDKIGLQRPISELPDEEISKMMWGVMPYMQKAVYHFLKVREEWLKRGLDQPGRFLKYSETEVIEAACQAALEAFDEESN